MTSSSAPVASLSPTSLNFASQAVNTASPGQTLTLSNTGNAALGVNSIAITGGNSGDFAQTNNCGSMLPPSSSCAIKVTFTPTATGSRTASLTITDNASDSPQSVGMTGTGAGPAPVASLSPTSLNFASQTVNTTGGAQTVTLSNTGAASLSISSITIAGGNSADFAQSHSCASSLAAGTSCAIYVTFTPSAIGPREAAVTISDNAIGSPQSVSLTGTGVTTPTSSSTMAAFPTSVSFGNVPAGIASADHPVSITNTGSAPFTITGISVAPPEFQVLPFLTLPVTLNPGDGTTIAVTFTPDAAQSFTGQLIVASNLVASPTTTVPLQGTGTSLLPGMAHVSLIARDNPPSGVTVLSFQVAVAGASLQPASASGAVPLTGAGNEIELGHLQTHSGYLGTANVAPGTYNSLTVTFANPTMTILNDSGATVAASGTSCASGQICQLQPPLTQTSVTVNSNPPFPLNLSADTGETVALDLDIDASVQNDLSITPAVSLTARANGQVGQNQGEDELQFFGLVQGIDNSNLSFTLSTGIDRETDVFETNAGTVYHFENLNCAAENFTCLAAGPTGSMVRVEAEVNNGTLTADAIEGVAKGFICCLPALPVPVNETLGRIASVNSGQGQFRLVINDVEDTFNSPGLALGLPATVSLESGATLTVDAGGLSLRGGLSFSSPADLLPGQEVGLSCYLFPCAFPLATSQVTLEKSDISGAVASVDTSQNTLTLTNLPSLFTARGITHILVETGSFTTFENVAGIGSLTANQRVSVGGLLLRNPNNVSEPILVSAAVRLRQN